MMIDKSEIFIILTQSFFTFCILDTIFKVNSEIKKKLREEKSVKGEIITVYVLATLFFYAVIYITHYLFFEIFNLYFSFSILTFDTAIRLYNNTFSFQEDDMS